MGIDSQINISNFSALVVGAGISGAAVARALADSGTRVLVVEAKNHIGGNCFDYRDAETQICVHKYGTHIFHTNNKRVWDFLSRFTAWHPYQHKVLAHIDGMRVPVPFNLNSIRQIFPPTLAERIEQKLLEIFPYGAKTTILELRGNADPDLQFLANFVYEKVFLHYTVKQWGKTPEEIDPSVLARVPIFVSRDDRYFRDKYQAIPRNGYTTMIEKMLDSPNIEVLTGTPFSAIEKSVPASVPVYFTGAIDALFGNRFGALPYRSVTFDFVRYEREFFQQCACENYPCNFDFTRIGEYKYFLDDRSPSTIVSFEYPSAHEPGKNEPCYPIANAETTALYAKYLELAARERPNFRFLGRLGDYRYYDMDKAVARALELIESERGNDGNAKI